RELPATRELGHLIEQCASRPSFQGCFELDTRLVHVSPFAAPAVMNADASEPRVTLVMTARERHSLAEVAIESIVSGTHRPYRFIYVDVESPGWLREVFAARSAEWSLEVVRVDEPLWPQQARMRVLDAIETEYTAFIDNDVEVETGWLEALVACADATGAGIVGPLYL